MDRNIVNKHGTSSKESLRQRLEQSGKRIGNEESNLTTEEVAVDNERLLLKNRLKETKKSRISMVDTTNNENLQNNNVKIKRKLHLNKYRLFVILLSIFLFIVVVFSVYEIVRYNQEKERQEIIRLHQEQERLEQERLEQERLEKERLEKERQKLSRLNYENNVKINKIGPSKKNFVDLGLPSGTLWATCNVGAIKPEQIGDFFAWGEVAPKFYYDKLTYKWWYDGDWTKYKYSNSIKTLELSDDVANVNWGGNWRMPTSIEIEELCDYTICVSRNLNGVQGYEFTSKMNGNTIFFPINEKYHGRYWSSSLWANSMGECLYLVGHPSKRPECQVCDRYKGLPVRPVMNKYNKISE